MKNLNLFKQNREKVFAKMQENSLAIISSAPEYPRNNDNEFTYRQDSDFYYLTGFTEPNALAILLKSENQNKFILFNQTKDPAKEQWTGYRAGQTGAVEIFGADEAFAMDQADQKIPDLLSQKVKKIYCNFGAYPQFDQKLIAWINQVRSSVRAGVNAPNEIIDVRAFLHPLRMIKSVEEIDLMRKSAKIAIKAHESAMRACKPNLYEYEIEAELMREYLKNGARQHAFQPIVASGANSCILHYNTNSCVMKAGDLVLVDSGCEYEYYTSDITRTFPINGKFSPEQKAIYTIVLEAQQEIINTIKPGVNWGELQDIAIRVITEGLINLKILTGNLQDLIAEKAYFPFFMHRFGHFMGIDCHDVGFYQDDKGWCRYQAGMVTSVEPGIYIKAGMPNIDPKWFNIGVRIEDDVLVTQTGGEVLTRELIRKPDEIEKFLA